jgi:hypothetical protein
MNPLEVLALLAPLLMVVLVLGVVLVEVWLDNRAERRKAR